MAILDFDSNDHEPLDGFETIPAGEYTASIVSSEMKATKNGQGEYLELVWQVLDGEHKGERVWQRIMLKHPSERCVNLSQRKLSAVCHALGVGKLNDSSELHNIPTVVRVSLKEEKGYGPSNDVVGFPELKKATEGGTPF